MEDTWAIRRKILALWTQFDAGKISSGEARTHIGFARTVLETLKVEIAAAHLSQMNVPVVELESKGRRNGVKRLSA